jgi:hypothetical protein
MTNILLKYKKVNKIIVNNPEHSQENCNTKQKNKTVKAIPVEKLRELHRKIKIYHEK